MANFWGATYEQVAQRIQGSGLDTTIFGAGTTTPQQRIEIFMLQAKEGILSNISDKATLSALTRGVFNGHIVIDQVSDTSQTSVDYGQEFVGTVNEATFRIAQNYKLTQFDQGMTSGFSIDTNVLTVSESKSLGDSFYAYYRVDPDTITVPQLAVLLIDMSAYHLLTEEVIGGNGDDGGVSDFVTNTLVPSINDRLELLRNDSSIAKLMRLNMVKDFASPNRVSITDYVRC